MVWAKSGRTGGCAAQKRVAPQPSPLHRIPYAARASPAGRTPFPRRTCPRLRRGCAACYAAEGIYPQDLEYLEEHYGVQVDGDRYVVHYEIFAQNLMPDITVLENKP